MEILKTQNAAWGFAGTIENHEGVNVDAAWDAAFVAISNATGVTGPGVRDFLDARDGRHFADSVRDAMMSGADLDAAIARAVAQHMGWTVGRKMGREFGIPVGLPYLTGWVLFFAILDDMAA